MSERVRAAGGWTALGALLLVLLSIIPAATAGGEAAASSRGNVYLFGRATTIDSPVDGTVQVWGGKVDITAPVAGDLLVFGGEVTLAGRGRVGGDVIYAGARVRGEEGRVGGRTHSLMSLSGAAATVSNGAIVASLLLGWLLLAIAVTLVAGREVRASSIEVRASALHCFTLGLVAFTSFVLTAIVFSYLVPYFVGIPLIAALGAVAAITKVFGLIAVFHAAGALVAGARSREQLESRRWLRGDLALVVIGLLLLGAIRMIPVVGTIVWSCASVFGIGCALATRFGRREPAFLAWSPVKA